MLAVIGSIISIIQSERIGTRDICARSVQDVPRGTLPKRDSPVHEVVAPRRGELQRPVPRPASQPSVAARYPPSGRPERSDIRFQNGIPALAHETIMSQPDDARKQQQTTRWYVTAYLHADDPDALPLSEVVLDGLQFGVSEGERRRRALVVERRR
jgi:hypothetical protein